MSSSKFWNYGRSLEEMVGEDALKKGGKWWGEDAKKRCQKSKVTETLIHHAKELGCYAIKKGEHI